jgi:alpha-L-rhamnosidase
VAYLFDALCEAGFEDAAYRTMNQTDYPSFGLMIEMGSTTLWETWGEAILTTTPEGSPVPVNTRRPMQQQAQSSATSWFQEYVAGIQIDPAHPGFKHFTLRPFCTGQLDWARGSYRSMYGLIESAWNREDDKLVWTVTVPPNTTATAHVPATSVEAVTESGQPLASAEGVTFVNMDSGRAVCTLQSGRYRFEAK